MTFIAKKKKIGDLLIKLSIYINQISNYDIIGKTVLIMYKFILQIFNMNLLPIVNAELYKLKNNNINLTLIENKREGITANIIMAHDITDIKLQSYKLPDIYLKEFNDVYIQGNSDIIIDIKNKCIINEKAYNNSNQDIIIDGALYRASKNVGLLRSNLKQKKKNINCGIMISGKFCNNYYHIMYENLIRLIYLDKINIPTDIPIIIDRKTISIPSCKKIFDILTEGSDRGTLTIDDDKLYHFKKLYYIDHINKLPTHSIISSEDSLAVYSRNAIITLREKLIKYKSEKKFYKRIFISRKNSKRRQYNEDDIYEILKKYDFIKIFPEEYSFEEQISIFNNADFIVTGSGAALTNLLFINQNCIIICFGRSSYNEKKETPIFNTIANINGGSFFYFPRKNKIDNNIHSNYIIDSKDFEYTLINILNLKYENTLFIYK